MHAHVRAIDRLPTPPWSVLTKPGVNVDEQCAALKASLEERARTGLLTRSEKRDPMLLSGAMKGLDGGHYAAERVGTVIAIPGSRRPIMHVHLSEANKEFWLDAYQRYRVALSLHPRPLSQAEFLGTVFEVCNTATGGPNDEQDLIRDLPNSIQHDPKVRKFWMDMRRRINYVLRASVPSESRLLRYTSVPAPVLREAIDLPSKKGRYRRMGKFARYCLTSARAASNTSIKTNVKRTKSSWTPEAC